MWPESSHIAITQPTVKQPGVAMHKHRGTAIVLNVLARRYMDRSLV
jgi:hypothetical protein